MTWDGPYTGSSTDAQKGGGMEHCGIYSGTGTTGGTAIKIIAVDSTNRPGYEGAGNFANGFFADGVSVTTPAALALATFTARM